MLDTKDTYFLRRATISRKHYNDVIASGGSHEEAMKAFSNAVGGLRTPPDDDFNMKTINKEFSKLFENSDFVELLYKVFMTEYEYKVHPTDENKQAYKTAYDEYDVYRLMFNQSPELAIKYEG